MPTVRLKTCAGCGTSFETTDRRKTYHDRACMKKKVRHYARDNSRVVLASVCSECQSVFDTNFTMLPSDPLSKAFEGRATSAERCGNCEGITEFVAVDGESNGKDGSEHRYTMLAVGQEQFENPEGISWEEAF